MAEKTDEQRAREKEFRRLRYEKNPEKFKAATRKYRATARYKEVEKAYRWKRVEWWKAHPEKLKEKEQRTEERRRERVIAKQILCACGCGQFIKSAKYGVRYAGWGHHVRGKEGPNTRKATVHPTVADIGWIAGFLEGEGSFHLGENKYGSVSCHQVQREPLERLQKYFGGTIYLRTHQKWKQPINVWYVHGSRARGAMLTVYSLMSPKRQEQIKKALG